MSLEEKRRLLLAFDVLIRSNVKGTAQAYAERLRVSKSTFFRLLEYMRNELCVPIVYDAARGGYVYNKEGMLLFGFVPFSLIGKENLKKLQKENKSYMEMSSETGQS